jgi:hypothetical protein
VDYFVGLDLGQSNDYTALAVVQKARELNEEGRYETHLYLRHLEQWQLRTPYTEIIKGVAAVVRAPVLTIDTYEPERNRFRKPKVELIVDATGVGRGVTDMLRAEGLRFTSVTITGGEAIHRSKVPGAAGYNVPKKDLVAALEVPFDTGRLKIAAGLTLWPVLREELQNFRRKQDPKTAHVSFEHWRGGDNDDLVLAAALACWGARGGPGGQRALRVSNHPLY